MKRLAKQSSEYEKNKKNQIVQVSRRIELYIDLDLENNNNQVKFYQFKHYPDNIERSNWQEVASKEITIDEFRSESSAREELFDIIFRITNPK